MSFFDAPGPELAFEASHVGPVLLLQPALAFVWDILFFARPTTPLDLLGVLLTLFAIYPGVARQLR